MIIIKISEFIYSWLKDLVILFALISLIDLIMPKGDMKKYINFTIGLLIIFTVINPFVNIGRFNFNLDDEILKNLGDINKVDLKDSSLILEEQEEEIEKIYKKKISEKINEIVREYNNSQIYQIDINIDRSEENYGRIKSLDLILYQEQRKNGRENIDIKISPINFKKTGKSEKNQEKFTQLTYLISEKLGIDKEDIRIFVKD